MQLLTITVQQRKTVTTKEDEDKEDKVLLKFVLDGNWVVKDWMGP